ncbi:alpha/beta-hydrolase [Aulographum hederae CBS 113979]|uniref:Alpha/beta-hydrolase n=1 Tax=Aulographum hederae CBS 113979 TaxID=1176131 RepID=A0A6G1HAB6_9PEZI|nr:alpha/beta-hydrolase [Aulographum hederae CBS 113979]
MSCAACISGSIHAHSGDFVGKETPDHHGYRTYITTPPSTAQTKPSPSTILFICDAFGLDLPNNKILADRYAASTGCTVVMPACIPGGPMPPVVMEYMDAVLAPVVWWDVLGQLRRMAAVAKALRYFVPMILKGHPKKALPQLVEYARKVKAEMPQGGKLGVAGFCWGGFVSIKLMKETATPGGAEKLVDAQFCAHPSFITPQMISEGIEAQKSPFAIALGTKDHQLSKPNAQEVEAGLRQSTGSDGEGENGFEWQFKYYEECGHGFAVRAAPGNKTEAQGAEDAAEQAIAWFNKHL